MTNILRKIPLFTGLKEEELEAINNVTFVKKVQKDQVILLEEEEGDTLFIILQGKVKVSSYSESGKEVIFCILGSGDFFGDMSLLDGKPRSASVIAVEDTEIQLIRRSDFFNIISEYPGIAMKLLGELASRIRKADDRIESLAILDVTGRVAGILIELAEQRGKISDKQVTIEARPTHQELANMVGTTRETVTRVMKQLELKDYIEVSGKDVTIINFDNFKNDLYL
ncbi:Crp/Fnr family transcriptional regulator [Candidatus Latescibacterota bacterium]